MPNFKFRLTSSLGSHFFFSLGKERVHTKPSSAPHPAEQRRPGAARAGVIAFTEVLGLHATDHSPILRIRTPVFYLKTYFFHIFYQQRLSKTKKNNIKKTKCYEKTPKLKLLPYLRIFFKIFTGINLTLFYNQPDHLDLQLKKVALFGCLVRGPSKAACNNLLVTSPTGVVPTGFSDSQPNKRMSKHVLVPVYRF